VDELEKKEIVEYYNSLNPSGLIVSFFEWWDACIDQLGFDDEDEIWRLKIIREKINEVTNFSSTDVWAPPYDKEIVDLKPIQDFFKEYDLDLTNVDKLKSLRSKINIDIGKW
jgi:hypothetical protein